MVAHLSPPHMVSSARYQAWAASLGPQWQHMLCCQGAQAVTLRRATVLQVHEGTSGRGGKREHREHTHVA